VSADRLVLFEARKGKGWELPASAVDPERVVALRGTPQGWTEISFYSGPGGSTVILVGHSVSEVLELLGPPRD
jgi:hypothetical protein